MARTMRGVLDATDVTRVVTRISHEILERDFAQSTNLDQLVLLGIPTRGAHLAARIAERIASFEGKQVAVGTLDVTLYRDDLRLRSPRPLVATTLPDRGIDDAIVVLVDDVLFSGRTVRAALDALQQLGRPRAVRLAVLVDRGHRELPIRADYVGKNIPTSLAESVHVRLVESDGVDEVVLGSAESSTPAHAGEAS